jgi:hypothetical protein
MTQTAVRPKGAKPLIRFRVRYENGMLIPEEAVSLSSGNHYIATLQPVSIASVDALTEIALMAQPLGPADLARNYDTYFKRVLDDETSG